VLHMHCCLCRIPLVQGTSGVRHGLCQPAETFPKHALLVCSCLQYPNQATRTSHTHTTLLRSMLSQLSMQHSTRQYNTVHDTAVQGTCNGQHAHNCACMHDTRTPCQKDAWLPRQQLTQANRQQARPAGLQVNIARVCMHAGNTGSQKTYSHLQHIKVLSQGAAWHDPQTAWLRGARCTQPNATHVTLWQQMSATSAGCHSLGWMPIKQAQACHAASCHLLLALHPVTLSECRQHSNTTYAQLHATQHPGSCPPNTRVQLACAQSMKRYYQVKGVTIRRTMARRQGSCRTQAVYTHSHKKGCQGPNTGCSAFP
jgi:hypothetical protein